MTRRLRQEKGFILPLAAVGLLAALAVGAAGVSFGRLTLVSTEGQNAADVAALAGAMAMFNDDNPWSDAKDAIELNTLGDGSARSDLKWLSDGFYDYDTRTYDPFGTPENAVRAIVWTNVDNAFGKLLGRDSSFVFKTATASFTGLRGARPTLPIVVGECHFPPGCTSNSCLPYLSQAPDPDDNSAWTGYFGTASKSKVEDYIPTSENCDDGGNQTEEIWIGDTVNINNGQITPLLGAIKCLMEDGMTQFLIPIVNCDGTFNQDRQVVGFATIEIDDVIDKGSAHFKGLYLHAISKSNASGALGGRSFGTGNVSLVPVDHVETDG